MNNVKIETLQVELDRFEIIGLIKSICPSYSLINELTNQGFGKYIGGFVEKWEWTENDTFWKKFAIEQLFDIYKNIKHAK
jgi:hypothetical protein